MRCVSVHDDTVHTSLFARKRRCTLCIAYMVVAPCAGEEYAMYVNMHKGWVLSIHFFWALWRMYDVWQITYLALHSYDNSPWEMATLIEMRLASMLNAECWISISWRGRKDYEWKYDSGMHVLAYSEWYVVVLMYLVLVPGTRYIVVSRFDQRSSTEHHWIRTPLTNHRFPQTTHITILTRITIVAIHNLQQS